MTTERQKDQQWIEGLRAENVRAVGAGGCSPPVIVAGRSRLDQAVSVAVEAYGHRGWNTHAEGIRDALLAGMKVLLGEPVGWQYLSDGKWISVGEPMANVFANHGRMVRRVYAPSLGEGHE